MSRTFFAVALGLGVLLATAAPEARAADDHIRKDGSLRYRFYTDWELLYVERDGTPSVEVGFSDPTPPTPSASFREILDTDDVVDDDEEFGGRGVLGIRLDERSSIELVFTGFGHDRDTRRRDISDTLFAFENPDAGALAGIDDNNFDAAVQFDLEYDSEFYSGEINYRRMFEVDGADYRFNLLAGIRAVRLEEDLNFFSIDDDVAGVPVAANGFGRYDVETRNSLIGVQLGVETEIPLVEDLVDFDLYAVGGAFANRADGRNEFADIDATPVTFRQSRSEWDDAGLIEGAAHLTVRLFRGIELKMGYRAIYLINVATAPDQFPRSGSAGDFFGNNYDNDGKTLFHGPSLGLKVAF